MDITFALGALDAHKKLSTFEVQIETTYSKIVTTLDGTEHGKANKRSIILVSFLPMTSEEASAYYNALNSTELKVKYSDPFTKADREEIVRVVSDLNAAFALTSVDGKNRYLGSTIRLRAIKCRQ